MDKNQIQKSITGLFLVILLLVSCQSRNNCGLKCGINMSHKEEEVCILFDTSLLKKPYVRYIPLPEINRINNDIRITALEIRTEKWEDYFEMSIVYDQTLDSGEANDRINTIKGYYDFSLKNEPLIVDYGDFVYYTLFDTLYGGYIQYSYNIVNEKYHIRAGMVDVYYVRKEAEDRVLSLGMKIGDNPFRSGDSLRVIQLINSISVLKECCDKKCLCFPD